MTVGQIAIILQAFLTDKLSSSQAIDEILSLHRSSSPCTGYRAALEKIADPLSLQVEGIGTERALRIITTMQAIAREALADSSQHGKSQ